MNKNLVAPGLLLMLLRRKSCSAVNFDGYSNHIRCVPQHNQPKKSFRTTGRLLAAMAITGYTFTLYPREESILNFYLENGFSYISTMSERLECHSTERLQRSAHRFSAEMKLPAIMHVSSSIVSIRFRRCLSSRIQA